METNTLPEKPRLTPGEKARIKRLKELQAKDGTVILKDVKVLNPNDQYMHEP